MLLDSQQYIAGFLMKTSWMSPKKIHVLVLYSYTSFILATKWLNFYLMLK